MPLPLRRRRVRIPAYLVAAAVLGLGLFVLGVVFWGRLSPFGPRAIDSLPELVEYLSAHDLRGVVSYGTERNRRVAVIVLEDDPTPSGRRIIGIEEYPSD